MSDTPRLGLPLLAAGQAQKHVTHNDALMRLDALVHLVVASRTQTVPPASPGETAAYIVPAGGTGVFAGHQDDLAIFEDGAWSFLDPRSGWQAWVSDEAEHHVWTGTQWRRSQPVSSLGAALWGVNTTADTTNRLSVSADATLFNHAGTDHRLKLNKASAARTASLLFQDNWSGRAEIGLAGDDQLRIKVSPDGSSWTEALVVDRTSGLVTLPASNWARETPRPNLLVNGDWQINQRGFAGGSLAAGAFGYDRWKAHTGGASLSSSGFDLTLTSGAIRQIVEPALWGVTSFASMPLCLSVEALSGGSLDVTVGSVSGTITAGSGRRFVALTPAAGDTGNLTVQLAPAAGAVTFRAIKLETGAAPSSWLARSQTQERQLCERYYWRPGHPWFIDCYQVGSAYSQQILAFPTAMRTVPTASYSVTAEANIFGGERSISSSSNVGALAMIRISTLGRAYAIFNDIAFSAEL
ncbi:conserved hypothetical protein [Bosea sp. 62]|uniref:DUF2793 domain-containing protein n=1 Tax=unclassified Bosea (in: a-proteobacteria) TaxID=2653178 RepID=UPI00125A74DC|nr:MULTISPECIES: DUF2793 domain-containing protein [unclassified Bosea (in: a-proteobacteria)]CAD5255328.1 conserved hypothetical protein [Bosea sp. 7B]CAD5275512.1 conserved hypothetical protein [Bosea sp. 21B]CAD5276596.1 conserved hypothetical protein [Bosea sp. 46]VVT59984.1 conserved hypothetical protein [Bosea sp. EC-HK365B]VXB50396.1 conserved hypothetical protein [Bosea sp. 62]